MMPAMQPPNTLADEHRAVLDRILIASDQLRALEDTLAFLHLQLVAHVDPLDPCAPESKARAHAAAASTTVIRAGRHVAEVAANLERAGFLNLDDAPIAYEPVGA